MNIALVVSTLLGYCAPAISPNTFWPFAFFGLALPYFLIANFIFIIYWLIQANPKFVLSLIILGLGYKSILGFVQIDFESYESQPTNIKVMSFNVRVFDLYMWTKEKKARNKIFEFLKKEDPDVLCLQEFYQSDETNPAYEFKTLDTLVQFLKAKNYHTYYTTTNKEKHHFGLVTFSKFPIVEKGLVHFSDSKDNACIYSDLVVNNRNIRIYNSHLASIKLGRRDYKTMKKINQKKYEGGISKSFELIDKIRAGFEKRAVQADLIRKDIESSPYPVIVCGDFNDTPSSYVYNEIRGKLKDSFLERGSGLGQTYIGEFPSFRIDYILYDEILSAKKFTTHQVELSDHKPVSAIFNFEE